MHVNIEPAFVIHSRKYTDTRLLVELFSENHGKVAGVYRPVKHGKTTLIPQPFEQLAVSWKGKAELKTITSIEPEQQEDKFNFSDSKNSQALYCAFYVNELLQRLLLNDDPHPRLFLAYRSALKGIGGSHENLDTIEPYLRNFEMELLAELGYGIEFSVDSHGDKFIETSGDHYIYIPEEGFRRISENDTANKASKRYSAEVIVAIARNDFGSKEIRRSIKQICREAIEPLLGGKPLKSRELFN